MVWEYSRSCLIHVCNGEECGLRWSGIGSREGLGIRREENPSLSLEAPTHQTSSAFPQVELLEQPQLRSITDAMSTEGSNIHESDVSTFTSLRSFQQ